MFAVFSPLVCCHARLPPQMFSIIIAKQVAQNLLRAGFAYFALVWSILGRPIIFLTIFVTSSVLWIFHSCHLSFSSILYLVPYISDIAFVTNIKDGVGVFSVGFVMGALDVPLSIFCVCTPVFIITIHGLCQEFINLNTIEISTYCFRLSRKEQAFCQYLYSI